MTPPSSDPTPENELDSWVNDARLGSPEALGELLEGCRQYLLLVANAELPEILQAKLGASDLVQETFLEAQRDFHHFQGHTEKEVLAWLRRIMLNNLRDAARGYLHTAKRELTREFSLSEKAPGGDVLGNELKSTVTPSWLARVDEQNALLAQALGRLSDEHQQVLVLRNLESLTFVQIAEIMNRSPDAVRKLWVRAIDALEKEMPDKSSS